MKKPVLSIAAILFSGAASADPVTAVYPSSVPQVIQPEIIQYQPQVLPQEQTQEQYPQPQYEMDPAQYNAILDSALKDAKQITFENKAVVNTNSANLQYLKPASGVIKNIDQYMNTTGIDDVDASRLGVPQ